MPPLQGGKGGAGFHKPRVRTLGWFVKALQAYIDTVRAVRESPLPTTLHSNLPRSELSVNSDRLYLFPLLRGGRVCVIVSK